MDALELQTAIVFIAMATIAFSIDFFAHKHDEKISLKQAVILVYFLGRRFGTFWHIFVCYAR